MSGLIILFWFIALFLLGSIVGSFLNVVGLRYRSGLSLGGRSACGSCGKGLRWWELVPIFSFLGLRGRCSACSARISLQYPLVEVWTGLLFATLSPLYWAIFCIFVVITIYDFRHKIIPDSLVYASVVLALVIRIFFLQSGLADWLVGPALFALFVFGWWVSRGRAVGFADGKLSLAVGFLLGASQGLSAIVLAFWIGTLVTVPLVLRPMLFGSKKLTMKSEIPFAPFIILGAWVSLLFHLDLFHLNLFS